MKKYLFLLTFSLLTLSLANTAFANKAIENKPASAVDRTTAITVEHEGNDSLGSRLAMKLKESFNSSNLFTLNEKNVPKFRLILSTVPEFKDRPAVGSAYSVIWVFSQSDETLRHYVGNEIGVFTDEEVSGLATKILEKTDGIAVRYAYLFE